MKRQDNHTERGRPWKPLYKQAMSFYEAGNFAQAAELFNQIADAPGVHGHLARFYHSRSCRKEAEMRMSAGQYDLASVFLNKAIESNGRCPTLLSFLAECHLHQGRYGQAGLQFEGLAELGDSPDRMAFKAALSYYLAGRSERAIEVLKDLVQKHPDRFEFNHQLGMMLAAEGQADRAIPYLNQACTLRRDSAECQWRLGLAHGAAGHSFEAVHHLQKAHRLDPGNNWILTHLTMAARQARHFGLEVDVQVVRIEEAKTPRQQDDLDRLAELIAGEPDFVTAFLDLPRSGMDEQIFSALLEILRRALARHPEFADLHFHTSCVCQRLGRTDEAIEHSRQALDLNPRFVNALIHLARLYADTHQHQQAIARLQAAIVNGANYADVHYLLGQLYQNQGYLEQAKRHYRQALSINCDFHAARQALDAMAA
ncbi:MAG: tetratricopeptide repeat protein [Phycisphaerae bacterium]|nr:tetratricopeptide repeat protein [Phycisphaerae bacterium]